VPYSDPIADGPVIQASYHARPGHATFRLPARDLRRSNNSRQHVSMPLVTMVSYAIIYRSAWQSGTLPSQAAGYAGVIVPDLLVDEADRWPHLPPRGLQPDSAGHAHHAA
jgi:tryptophan synthase alpha chain